MEIIMRSDVYEIKSIKRKTQANIIKDWVVGDLIQLSVPASRVGSSRGRTYSSFIEIVNLRDNSKTHFTFNQISTLYNAFELEKLQPHKS